MNKIETVTLENGLTIYLYEDKRKHTTIFQLITKFGGATKDFIIDNKEVHLQDGIAHILEHFIVEYNNYGNFLDILGQKEMNTNAITTQNCTRYFFQTVENVEFGIKTILNCIYSPIFTNENLEKLKEPIYQEIRGKENNLFFHENIEVLKNVFHKVNFHSTGGTIEEVKNTTVEDVKLCYESFYQPENQLIIIAGNFEKDKALKIIKEKTKKLNIPKHNIKKINIKEKKEVKKKDGQVTFPTPASYLEVTYKVPISHLSNIEKLKLDFYIHYFFDMNLGVTSSLYKKLVKEKIITTGINHSNRKINDYLLISIGAYTKEKTLLKEEIIKAIKNIIIDKEIFELDKKNTILEVILREENLSSVVGPLIENIIDFDYPYLDTVEDIQKLNFEEYKNMISSLDFSNYTITTVDNPKDSN